MKVVNSDMERKEAWDTIWLPGEIKRYDIRNDEGEVEAWFYTRDMWWLFKYYLGDFTNTTAALMAMREYIEATTYKG